MALLGDRNWYLPTWLSWLPDLRIEGGSAVVPHPAAVPLPPPVPPVVVPDVGTAD